MIEIQQVHELARPGMRVRTIGAGATIYWPDINGFSNLPRVVADGREKGLRYIQLVGYVANVGANPLTLNIEGSPDPINAGWASLAGMPVIVASGATREIVVDLTAKYIRVSATSAAGTTVALNADLFPVAALESTRAAASADVVSLDTVETTHHLTAVAAPADGVDAVLDGSYSVAEVHLIGNNGGGALAAGIEFYKSENGVTFVQVLARREAQGGGLDDQYAFNGATNEVFEVNVSGAVLFRVRLSAFAGAVGDSVTVTSKAIQGAQADMEGKDVGAGDVGLGTRRVTLGSDDVLTRAIRRRMDFESVIDNCEVITGWAGNAQVANLALTPNHVRGNSALTFDKVAGGATAQIERAVTAVDLLPYMDHDLIGLLFYLADITNVDYAYVRLGMDVANCSEWRIQDEDITAGLWMSAKMALSGVEPTVIGNGCSTAITYVAFGVVFDAAGDLLADIRLDSVVLTTSRHSTAQLNAEISTEISSPNINLARVADTPTSVGLGLLGAGVQRVGALIHDGVNYLRVAFRGLASAGYGVLKMLEYNAVPPVVADGQQVPAQGNAYGHEETAAFSRALGGDVGFEGAPWKYDQQPITLRALAALAAAYDAAPTEVPTGNLGQFLLHLSYDENAAATNGRVRVRIQIATTIGGTDNWSDFAAAEQQALVQGTIGVTWVEPSCFEFDPLAAATEAVTIRFDITGAHKIRCPAAESGDIVNPGQCVLYGVLRP